MPAKVIEYDRAANRARVQPLIDIVTTDGTSNQRAQIASVPVLAYGGGGFVINFPLEPGDLGWIEASDRDISLFLQSLDRSRPNTYRLHEWSDSRFIPDIFRRYSISDAGKMVIQSTDGTTKITLSADTVEINAPNVVINGGQATVNVPTTVTAFVTFTAPVVMTSGLTVNEKSVADHYHGGVETGPGDTGPMVGGS